MIFTVLIKQQGEKTHLIHAVSNGTRLDMQRVSSIRTRMPSAPTRGELCVFNSGGSRLGMLLAGLHSPAAQRSRDRDKAQSCLADGENASFCAY